MKASIIIRTYNECEHLPHLLNTISVQNKNGLECETIVVDSGSTDGTIAVADKADCNIIRIDKNEFSFGRSLNRGCDAASGDILVFISGHCVPRDANWLANLVKPVVNGDSVYVYGRQIGNGKSKFSEHQLFKKYFPENSCIPQEGYFCNNANAALLYSSWLSNKFDELVTGLEDMELGKRLVAQGLKLAYVAEAAVYHIHEESWGKVRNRYEREAVALQHIMPEIHLSLMDMFRYYSSAVLLDIGAAHQEKKLFRVWSEIALFRLMQFWGAYRGNHEHRKVSKQMKERYFYPK